MKPAVESAHAWELLLNFWNTRDSVIPENQCKAAITYKDRADERCVLDKAHTDGEMWNANIPHADKDGNIAPLIVTWETIRQAQNFDSEDE